MIIIITAVEREREVLPLPARVSPLTSITTIDSLKWPSRMMQSDRRASKREKSINFFTRIRNLITSHVSFTNTVSKHSATDIVDDSIATDDTAAAETMAAAAAAEVSTPSLAPEIWAHVRFIPLLRDPDFYCIGAYHINPLR